VCTEAAFAFPARSDVVHALAAVRHVKYMRYKVVTYIRYRAGGKQDLEFNMQNVDSVLDTVRPYLIADGGNCKVVDVDQACVLILLYVCPHTPAAGAEMQLSHTLL